MKKLIIMIMLLSILGLASLAAQRAMMPINNGNAKNEAIDNSALFDEFGDLHVNFAALRQTRNVFSEDFESGAFPTGWTLLNPAPAANPWVVVYDQGGGYGFGGHNSTYTAGNFYQDSYNPRNAWMITPAFTLAAGNEYTISFWLNLQGFPDWDELDFLEAYIGTDATVAGMQAGTQIYYNVTTPVPDWAEITYTYTPTTAGSYYLGWHSFTPAGEGNVIAIDDISVVFPVDNDLAAASLSGTSMTVINNTSVYTIRVANVGTAAVAAGDYTVRLMQGATVLGTPANGRALQPGEYYNYLISWTPTTQGAYAIHGNVLYAADGMQDNNSTAVLNVTVGPEGQSKILVGDPNSSSNSSQIPFNTLWETSVTQSIYLASEIDGIGEITALEWKYIFSGSTFTSEKPIRIWMGNTTKSAFANSSDWEPVAGLTLVYDGLFPFNLNTGTNDITVTFNEDTFMYTGGNLLIMAEKVWSDGQYTTTNFRMTNTSGQNRSLSTRRDTNAYDVTNLPAADNIVTGFPSVYLTMLTATGTMGKVTGTVFSSSNPVDGAELTLSNSEGSFTSSTDNEGAFTFNIVPPGTYSLVATKYMYDTVTVNNIVVNANATTTVPQINLPGVLYNLAALTIAGPSSPQVNTPENYTVTIQNQGLNTVPGANYTVRVRIVGQPETSFIGEVSGATINSNETLEITVPATYTTSGTMQIFGYIAYSADENQANNSTPNMNVLIVPDGLLDVYVGDEESTTRSEYVPIRLYNYNSVSQTIYTEEEIGMVGEIYEIVWNYERVGSQFTSDASIRIRMGTTAETAFTSTTGWIPSSGLTLVYEGLFPVQTPGNSDIRITFNQNSFNYSGGNLVVMVERIRTGTQYETNTWLVTNTPSQNQSLQYASDTAFDTTNPTQTGTYRTLIPNIVLSMKVALSFDDDLAALSITGTTQPNAGNLVNYSVSVRNLSEGDVLAGSYKAQVYRVAAPNNILLGEADGVALTSLQTASIVVPVTFAAAGSAQIFGFVDFTPASGCTDVNMSNNTTSLLNITIRPAGLIDIYVGDPSSATVSLYVPIYPYYNNSVTQTIYHANEIAAPGDIYGLTWTYSRGGTTFTGPKPIKIYLAHTEVEAFDSLTGWLPASQFTLVYEGDFPFNTNGTNEIPITFTTPFTYTGGNLVMMAEKPYSDSQYENNSGFLVTQKPEHRALTVRKDGAPSYDVNNLPEAWGYVDAITNMNLTMLIELAPYDINAMHISGPTSTTALAAFTYTVSVRNFGQETLNAGDYKVRIRQVGQPETSYLAEVDGIQLGSTGVFDYELSVTFPDAGNAEIFGYVFLTPESGLTDANLDNNTTQNLAITIYPAGSLNVTIGTGSDAAYYHPFNYFYRSSVAQTIYLASEIGSPGEINAITYNFNGAGDVIDGLNVSIFMQESAKTNYSGSSDWEPIDLQDGLVYYGPLSVNASGLYFVEIPLDTPFNYNNDGSLIITTVRHYSANYYGSANTFRRSATSNSRTLYYYNDTTEASLEALPTASGSAQYLSNIQIMMSVGPRGTLSGTVTSAGNPVADVQVQLDGTTRKAYTNNAGVYTMINVPEGQANITGSKFGYLDYHNPSPITIIADQVNSHDFSIAPRPTVAVSGVVLASDTGAGLVGASLKLEGYDDYTATSGAGGAFSFPTVYAESVYTLTITADGYTKYVDDLVEVGSTALNLGNITVNEKANKPSHVVAEVVGTNTQITWQLPTDGEDIWFNYVLGNNADAWGVSSGTLNMTMAHRYPQTYLNTAGVWDAEITKIAYYVYAIPTSGTMELVIYTGSTTLASPGTLVYSQAVDIPPAAALNTYYEYDLATPFPISGFNGELRVGISFINHNAGYFLGTDSGGSPVANFSDVFQGNDGTWTSSTAQGYYNESLMLKVMASGATGPRVLSYNAPTNPYVNPRWLLSKEERKPRDPKDRQVFTAERAGVAQPMIYTPNPIPNPTPDSRILIGYRVYRTLQENLNNESLWTTLVQSQTDLSYTDITWSSLDNGVYHYLVRSIYTNNVLSEPGISNIVTRGMESLLTFRLSTTDGGSPIGATIKLVNNADPQYTYDIVASANEFNQLVWKGTYTLTVKKQGYLTFQNNNLLCTDDALEVVVSLVPSGEIFFEDFDASEEIPDGWQWFGLSYYAPIQGGMGIDESNMALIEVSDYYDIPVNYAQTPSIGPLPANATLNFFYDWWDTYDIVPGPMLGSTIQIKVNNTTIHTIDASNYVQNGQYKEVDLSLANYAGQSITIQFYITYGDPGLWQDYGMFLDNVSVRAPVGISDDPMIIPLASKLHANYPNPFNPTTTISFDTPKDGNVQIDIFNIKGQKVKSLVNDHFAPGTHKVVWNGTDDQGQNVGSGIFFYRMKSEGYETNRKMILMK